MESKLNKIRELKFFKLCPPYQEGRSISGTYEFRWSNDDDNWEDLLIAVDYDGTVTIRSHTGDYDYTQRRADMLPVQTALRDFLANSGRTYTPEEVEAASGFTGLIEEILRFLGPEATVEVYYGHYGHEDSGLFDVELRFLIPFDDETFGEQDDAFYAFVTEKYGDEVYRWIYLDFYSE